MSVSQRLEQLIDYLGITKNHFAKRIGIGSTTINNSIARGSELKTDVLRAIAKTYTSVNLYWLILGEEPMMFPSEHSIEDVNMNSALKIKYLKNRIRQQQSKIRMAAFEFKKNSLLREELEALKEEMELLQSTIDSNNKLFESFLEQK